MNYATRAQLRDAYAALADAFTSDDHASIQRKRVSAILARYAPGWWAAMVVAGPPEPDALQLRAACHAALRNKISAAYHRKYGSLLGSLLLTFILPTVIKAAIAALVTWLLSRYVFHSQQLLQMHAAAQNLGVSDDADSDF